MFILSVCCSCSTSNSAEISQQPVAKLRHIKFHQVPVRGSRVIACVQMESQNTAKSINTFPLRATLCSSHSICATLFYTPIYILVEKFKYLIFEVFKTDNILCCLFNDNYPDLYFV